MKISSQDHRGRYNVKLNGHDVGKICINADDEEGTVEVMVVCNPGAKVPDILRNKLQMPYSVQTATLKGKVEITEKQVMDRPNGLATV